MNKLLNLLFIDMKLLSKSKVFYLKLILFPCALILILGTMFGNSSSKLTKFNVAFFSEDSSITKASGETCLSSTLRDNVLSSPAAKAIFTLKNVTSYEAGKQLVKDKKVVAFIYVPQNFTKAYVASTKTSIILIADNNKQIDKGIVKNMIDSFYKNVATIRTEETALKSDIASNNKIDNAKLQDIIDKIQSTNSYGGAITKVSTNRNSKPLDVMQYEAIAMIVMFSILTAFELAHSIVEDKLNNTQFRIKSTPTLSLQYALGKVLGIVLAITVQMSVVMLISHFVFKVDFGNILYILLTTLCYGFTIGAIVFCAGTAAKDQMSISSFASIILYGGSFLGGSFVSVDGLPKSLQTIQQIIPNGKAINCYLKICQGGNLSNIYADLIGLIIIGLIFLVIALNLYDEGSIYKYANNNNDKKSIKAAV